MKLNPYLMICNKRMLRRDFPEGPVVKTPHSQCRGTPGSIPVRELRSHILHSAALKNKTQNNKRHSGKEGVQIPAAPAAGRKTDRPGNSRRKFLVTGPWSQEPEQPWGHSPGPTDSSQCTVHRKLSACVSEGFHNRIVEAGLAKHKHQQVHSNGNHPQL